MKRNLKCAAMVGCVVSALLLAGPAQAADKATFILDWIFYGNHVGFVAADEKGYYKAENIDVDIVRGHGSGDTVKRLGSKVGEFGYPDMGALIAGRSRGATIREIAVIIGKAPHSWVTYKKMGVSKPKDLEGKKIGSPSHASARLLFPAFASVNNIDMKKITWVNLSPPAKMPSLLSGKVDVIEGYVIEEPRYREQLKKEGKELVAIYHKDWGLNVYANGIATHDDIIANRPDYVRRFLRATLKGVAWSFENPKGASEVFIKKHVGHKMQSILAEWKVSIEHLSTPEAKINGIGYMSRDRVKFTRDIVTKHLKLPKTVPLDKIYTNDFNPKIVPKM